MKTKEELNALKNEVEVLNAKLAELSEEEMMQVIGGIDMSHMLGRHNIREPLSDSNLPSDWGTNIPGWEGQWF